MKKKKIEELFDEYDTYIELDISHFTEFINKIEKELKLEWYKKLDKKLDDLTDYDSVRRILDAINRYQAEIQNKIKELENENN